MNKSNSGIQSVQPNGVVPISRPDRASKWKKYILGVFVNALLWAFIAIGFFVIALVSNKLGIIRSLPDKVASVAKFFDATFIAALFVGIVLMTSAVKLINDFFLKLRKTFPAWEKLTRKIISDREFGQYCQSEIFSQINNVANLSLLAGIFFQMDRSRFGNSILESSTVDSIDLLKMAGLLYSVALFFYWLYADPKNDD